MGESIETVGDGDGGRGCFLGYCRQRARVWRLRVRANPKMHRFYKVGVGLVGATIVVGGLLLVPLPGPGWLIVFLGLAILSSEFERARRLQRFARRKVQGWTRWLSRQSWVVRAAVGLATLAFVGCVVYLSVSMSGGMDWITQRFTIG